MSSKRRTTAPTLAGCALATAATMVAVRACGVFVWPQPARADAQIVSSSLESAVAESGRYYYLRYCASCHGGDALGKGVVAQVLRTEPPDLTRISQRRNGTFPMDEIAATIDGRKLPAAHGVREMPVWGERLAEEFQGATVREQVLRGQLLMLLVYLQSIQR